MTIPYIDFRRNTGPRLGQQILAAGAQGLIADAFRKSAEKRAETRQISAEGRADAASRSMQEFGADLAFDLEQRRNVGNAEFQMGQAIETGQLMPEAELTDAQRVELGSIGAQVVIDPKTQTRYYSTAAVTAAAPIDPNIVAPLNRLMSKVGLAGDIRESGRSPEGIVSQQNLATMSPLLTSLKDITQSEIGKRATEANLLAYVTGEPDMQKWAGYAVREEGGELRPLLMHEIVGLDKVGNYEVLHQQTNNPWYLERFEYFRGIEDKLEQTSYADPNTVGEFALKMRADKGSDPVMDQLVNQAWTVGADGLLWEVRQGKEPRPIRDRGEARRVLSGNQPLLEALIYEASYPNADALLAARAARHPMPSPAALGYLQHIWRLRGEKFTLPPDFEVWNSVPEASIYMEMSPAARDISPFMDPNYRQGVGEITVPIQEPSGGPDITTSPAMGVVTPEAQPGAGTAPVSVVPTANLEPSEVNYNQAYTTAYAAIASDSARYTTMVDAINAAFASPQSALEYYLGNAATADSDRVAKLREMIESGDSTQVRWAEEAMEWDRNYTLQLLKQARDDYLEKNAPAKPETSIPRIVP